MYLLLEQHNHCRFSNSLAMMQYAFKAIRLLYAFLFIFLATGCNDQPADTVTDIDGNVYPVVRIGNQVWMAQNLRVTRYRNGVPILLTSGNSEWSNAQTGAFCCYNNDTTYTGNYGLLYNWYAINDKRTIAPEGWHIPDADEIAILVNTLRGDTSAGGFMKTPGTHDWLFPNTGATNASGFAALPGGYRDGNDGWFHTFSSNGYWWHTTGSYELYCWSNRFYNYFAEVKRDPQYFTFGFSVRCIKDN